MKDIDKHMIDISDKWIDHAREKDNWKESFLENISRRKNLPVKSNDPAFRCLSAMLRDVPELKHYELEDVWHYLQWRCREACDWPGDVDWEPPEFYEDFNTDNSDKEKDNLKEAEALKEQLMRPSGCSFDEGCSYLRMMTNMKPDETEVLGAIMAVVGVYGPHVLSMLLTKAFGKDAVISALNIEKINELNIFN